MFQFTLVTPEKKIVTDSEIDEVVVPAFRGELNILPGHAPLVTTLGTGVLRYKLKGASDFETAAIGWGYCEVSPTGVSVLAETAETREELDRERAELALKKAQEKLMAPDLEPNQLREFQRKIAKAQARLELAKK